MSEAATIPWGPVGKDVYERTYSRYKEDESKETWPETVQRVVDGNLGLVDKKGHEEGEREKLIDLIQNFKIVPAGRHLWMSGARPGRNFLNNCWVANWRDDLVEHFEFVFDMLMQGGGVGTNYSNRLIGSYEPVNATPDIHIVCSPSHPDYKEFVDSGILSQKYLHDNERLPESVRAVVPGDSREGWCEALGSVMRAFWSHSDNDVVVDLSNIREKGQPIRGFGGTASGPLPLAQLLVWTADLLSKRDGQQVTSLDLMQVDHWIGSCVVAGNSRRSARMSIKHWKDEDIFDFIHCKADQSNHWTTNISVEIDDEFFDKVMHGDPHAVTVYQEAVRGMLTNGEPGFFNHSKVQEGEVNELHATNPCVVSDTWVETIDGPVQVKDLIDMPYKAMVDGTPRIAPWGFFKTGVKPVYELITADGHSLKLTYDHQVLTQRDWVQVGDLEQGDQIALHAHESGNSNSRSFTRFRSLEYVGEEEVFDTYVPDIHAFDANGLYVHNCGELVLEDGAYCCLGHVNLDVFHNDLAGMYEAHRLMTRFLIRATFGDITWDKSREIGDANRRIGVGHFGYQGFINKRGIRFSDSHESGFVRRTLAKCYEVCRKEARSYAFKLRIPEPIKVTAVAPTGSISKLAGRTEGIHPILYRYFINNIRFSILDPNQLAKIEEYERQGYKVEDCIYSANTKVVSFLAKHTLVQEVADQGYDPDEIVEEASEISLEDMLAVQKMYQQEFVDNAISFTINIPGESVRDVNGNVVQMEARIDQNYFQNILLKYLPYLKGTTIMVDGSRDQAPYQRVSKEDYERLTEGIGDLLGEDVDEMCAKGGCPIK